MEEYIRRLQKKEVLDFEDFHTIFLKISENTYDELQVAVLFSLLYEMPENHLVPAAKALRSFAIPHLQKDGYLDVCGTGGDGMKTFNISTAVALLLESYGIPISKHGNRAVSSNSGSSDVLEVLGVQSERLAVFQHFFLSAQEHYPLLRNIQPLRRQLAVPTFFNLLGPLLHPSDNLTYQFVGVHEMRLLEPYAHALHQLGRKRVCVVHGLDGMDEITLTTQTQCVSCNEEGICSYYCIQPTTFGISLCSKNELLTINVKTSAQDIWNIFTPNHRSPKQDIVLLNAAYAAAIVADEDPHILFQKFQKHIDEGKVYEYMNTITGGRKK